MEQIEVIPFQIDEYKGGVKVSVTEKADAKQSGYDYLFELSNEKDIDFNTFKGFPTMHARVSSAAPG